MQTREADAVSYLIKMARIDAAMDASVVVREYESKIRLLCNGRRPSKAEACALEHLDFVAGEILRRAKL